MRLPCCHIFAVRYRCGANLYDSNLCLRRWTCEYYVLHQRVFQNTNCTSLLSERVTMLASTRVEIGNLPQKVTLLGRSPRTLSCIPKIKKKKVKVYSEKSVEDHKQTLLRWLGIPNLFMKPTFNGEMILEKQDLSVDVINGSITNSFKDENVCIESLTHNCHSYPKRNYKFCRQ